MTISIFKATPEGVWLSSIPLGTIVPTLAWVTVIQLLPSISRFLCVSNVVVLVDFIRPILIKKREKVSQSIFIKGFVQLLDVWSNPGKFLFCLPLICEFVFIRRVPFTWFLLEYTIDCESAFINAVITVFDSMHSPCWHRDFTHMEFAHFEGPPCVRRRYQQLKGRNDGFCFVVNQTVQFPKRGTREPNVRLNSVHLLLCQMRERKTLFFPFECPRIDAVRMHA